MPGFGPSRPPLDPALADACAVLDRLLLIRLRLTFTPGAAYLAFRQWPRDRAMRDMFESALRDELEADPEFNAAVAGAVDTIEAVASLSSSATGAMSPAAAVSDAGASPAASPTSSSAASTSAAPLADEVSASPSPSNASATPLPLPLPLVTHPTPGPPTSPADPLATAGVVTGTPAGFVPPTSTRTTWTAAIAATLLIAAAGSGITIASLSSRTGGPGHYTFADDPTTNPLDDFTVFDWTTDTHGTVTGMFRAVDPADHTNDFTQPFTGHQEGRTLTFVVTATLGTTKSTLRGTLTSGTLTFHPPLGTTAQPAVTYRKTTMAAFTKAVHDFEALHPTTAA